MTIFEQLLSIFMEAEDRLYTAGEIKSELARRYGTNPSSVIPSDYCYNRRNHGLTSQKPIFVRVGSSEYRFIGPDQPYTGLIFGRPRWASAAQVIGEWIDGEMLLYPIVRETENQAVDQSANWVAEAPVSDSQLLTLPLSREQLDRIFEEYLEILALEVEEFGCKPTETRHLVGRLGELFCARKTRGHLARRVNQHGFDVVAQDGRRVSVDRVPRRGVRVVSRGSAGLVLS